jgi:hypothetical protein
VSIEVLIEIATSLRENIFKDKGGGANVSSMVSSSLYLSGSVLKYHHPMVCT